MVAVAQLVRAPDCGSGGCGFDARLLPHSQGYSSTVEHQLLELIVAGSNPAAPLSSGVAKWPKATVCKTVIPGSNPGTASRRFINE